jgi:hypothetical protein
LRFFRMLLFHPIGVIGQWADHYVI